MCGIVGIVSGKEDVAEYVRIGLWSLQHRGQESAGVVSYDGRNYLEERGMGMVDFVFRHAPLQLPGKSAIGHVRYSTTGASNTENIQPVRSEFNGVTFWLGHNGNLINTEELRRDCQERGYNFHTSTDTEVIAALIHFSHAPTFLEALQEALIRVVGTYSLVLLYKNEVYGVRDPTGNLPFMVGGGRDLLVLASESVTCDVLGVKFLREILPGEVVVLRNNPLALETLTIPQKIHMQNRRPCLFEFVYFLRPDGKWEDRRIQLVRELMGEKLWQECPVAADVVIPVPDSGNAAAKGLARAAGLPFEKEALFRSHYVGRTFIEPRDEDRERHLNVKLNPIPELIQNKRLIVVDDSVVRSRVIKRVIKMLRGAGAQEVHIRVSSPPYLWPCFYGKDTYHYHKQGELIAHRHNGDVEAIRKEIGADSLGYLSLGKVKEAVIESGTGLKENNFCDACFTGEYHIGREQIHRKLAL